MENLHLKTTNELNMLLEYFELDSVKYERELEVIKQELIIRELSYCKPLCDVLERAF